MKYKINDILKSTDFGYYTIVDAIDPPWTDIHHEFYFEDFELITDIFREEDV